MKVAEFIQALATANVRFVIVGGVAVQLHGFLRSTFDLDLVLEMEAGNLEAFIEVAKSHRLRPSIPVPIESLKDPAQLAEWHREKGMLAFSLREPESGGAVVDVLVAPEVSFEHLRADAVAGAMDGSTVWIASTEHLLVMKRSADRPKDRLDVIALEKIRKGVDPNA